MNSIEDVDLGVVSFERASLMEYACQKSLSLMVQQLKQRLKLTTDKQTGQKQIEFMPLIYRPGGIKTLHF